MSRSLVLTALVALLVLGVACSRSGSEQPAAQPAAAGAQAPATAAAPNPPSQGAPPAGPTVRNVTIPANTTLRLRLDTLVASDSSRVEDAVRASVARSVVVHGVEAVPVGSALNGVVTDARRSGKVKGRARVAFRFEEIAIDGRQQRVQTRTVAMEAPSTKRNDALKIGAPAAGGALLGALLGGKKGAAIGAGVGGGAGTAVVLATPGKEVRLTPGTMLTVRLTEPVTVTVPGDR